MRSIMEGKRVKLRGLELEDAEFLHKNMNNAKMTQYLYFYKPFSLQEEEEFIKKTWEEGKKGTDHTFGIVEKKTEKLIGVISLNKVDNINRSAEVGIWIGEEYWGKGYGSEAEELLIRYGFEELNLNSIYVRVFGFNKRSIAAAKKAGFKEVGKRRQACYRHGEYHDMILLDILRSEFE